MHKKLQFSLSRTKIVFCQKKYFSPQNRGKNEKKWEKRKIFWFFYNFESTHIRVEKIFCPNMRTLEIVKKSKIFPFFPLFFIFFPFFFHFLELKYNVKNKNLENQISSRENENCNFLCIFFPYFLQKKILFSLSYG